MRFSFVVLCSIWLSLGIATKTDVFNLSMIDWIANFPPGNPPALLVPIQLHTAGRLAIDLVNNGTFPDILPNTHINLEVVIDGFSASKAIAAMIDFSEKGHTLAIGFPLSDIALPTATVGTVYGVAQIASAASAAPLSDKSLYPYFSRLASAPSGYPHTIKEALIYYESIRGRGWTDVAVISAVASFVNNIATTFIDISEPEITILTFQQFLLDQFAVGNLDVEFRELERSGARVFFAPIFDGWLKFLGIADSYGLVGDHYVWIAPPSIVGVPYPEPSELARGSIGAVFATRTPDDPILQNFLEIWTSVDPDIYIGAGPGATFGGSFVSIAFDTGIAAAMAIDKLEKSGQLSGSISPELWSETIRSLEFEGLSNDVSFLPNGDRVGKFNLQYYNTEANNWFTSATWTALDGYEYKEDVIWYSNSTEIPDLDIRDPFNYWSCHDKEKKRDPTGKTVSLQTPDSEDVDDIDSTYHCDNFIDCWNMSDESVDCSANYVGVFIAFGIVTGLLILLSILFFVVVIIFGVVLGYRRMRTASPFFLNVLLLSVILGYCSTYAWYGKPHKVACAFQPWLLGLSSISMIACLAVKNLRIWRIFKFPLKKTKITNAELLIFWLIVMIPAIIILILWTIISTPTAGMEERKDEDHYVCKTGGFTGSPGGLIFFFILVGYTALVLVFAAIISILIRNVPSQFSEVRLLTISIYNLGFLSVVIIPVYLVVQPFNPFIAWILRTSAILYAFTATLFIQFVPIIIGIFLIDKGQNNAKFKSFIKSDLAFANANNSDEASITNSKA